MRSFISIHKIRKMAGCLLTGLILLAGGCRGGGYVTQTSFEELLVILGKHTQNESCSVVVFNPMSQEQTVFEQRGCELSIVEIDSIPHIALSDTEPNTIDIYSVNSTEGLEKEFTYFLEDVRITSKPIIDKDGSLYVNGIIDNKEQILQLTQDSNSMTVLPLYEDGPPILSPGNVSGNDYIIYYNFEGKETRLDCRLNCYPYFKLYNIKTGEHLDLRSILPESVPTSFTHCHELWSPDHTHLAFTVGCYSETPNQIVILDVLHQKITQVINPLPGDSGVESIVWLSDTQLIYRSGSMIDYALFSVEDGEMGKLLGLSLEREGEIFNIRDLNFNLDAQTFVGTSLGNTQDFQTRSVVVGGIMDDDYQTKPLLGEQCNITPKLSPSNNWVAFSSAKDCDSATKDGVTIGLLDKLGNVINQDIGIPFMKEAEYYWVNTIE